MGKAVATVATDDPDDPTDLDDPKDLDDRIRARLRQLRFERQLTVAQLAQRAGVATSTVSRLETGARTLGLHRLARIATALNTDLPDLIASARSLDSPSQAADGKIWTALSHDSPDAVRAYRLHIPPDLRDPELNSHPGTLWLLVLGGRLHLRTVRAMMELRPGDATTIGTWTPHGLGAVDAPVDLLAVYSPTSMRTRTLPG